MGAAILVGQSNSDVFKGDDLVAPSFDKKCDFLVKRIPKIGGAARYPDVLQAIFSGGRCVYLASYLSEKVKAKHGHIEMDKAHGFTMPSIFLTLHDFGHTSAEVDYISHKNLRIACCILLYKWLLTHPHNCSLQLVKREPNTDEIESVKRLKCVLLIAMNDSYQIAYCDRENQYRTAPISLEELNYWINDTRLIGNINCNQTIKIESYSENIKAINKKLCSLGSKVFVNARKIICNTFEMLHDSSLKFIFQQEYIANHIPDPLLQRELIDLCGPVSSNSDLDENRFNNIFQSAYTAHRCADKVSAETHSAPSVCKLSLPPGSNVSGINELVKSVSPKALHSHYDPTFMINCFANQQTKITTGMIFIAGLVVLGVITNSILYPTIVVLASSCILLVGFFTHKKINTDTKCKKQDLAISLS